MGYAEWCSFDAERPDFLLTKVAIKPIDIGQL